MTTQDVTTPSTLSHRSIRTPIDLEYVNLYSSWPAIQNPYHEVDNPEGIINLGTAVNGLMDDVWLERMKTIQPYQPNQSHFRYYQFWGPDDFRQKLATFMNHFFRPRLSILHENLYILNGALTSLDILSFLLADENDVILCPVPGYNGYFQAGTRRWNTNVVSVPFTYSKKSNEDFHFTIEVNMIEQVALAQKSEGKNIRAIILNNPNNPLGMVLPTETIADIMRFCHRERIHLIADEMYCMSVFDHSVTFQSVLEIHTDELLDENLIHVIWGFSKDLCLTSYRTGVIHTRNTELQLQLMSGSQFQAVALPIMEMLDKIISDVDWFRNKFVPLNHQRLKESYETASKHMKSLGIINISKARAGFFFLADFRPLLTPCTEATCKALIRVLYENRVYVTPGWEMRAETGWFRIVFPSYSKNGLNEGLKRLSLAVEDWKLRQGAVMQNFAE